MVKLIVKNGTCSTFKTLVRKLHKNNTNNLLRLHTDCTEIAKCYQTAIKVNVVDVPVSAVFAFVDNIPKTHTG